MIPLDVLVTEENLKCCLLRHQSILDAIIAEADEKTWKRWIGFRSGDDSSRAAWHAAQADSYDDDVNVYGYSARSVSACIPVELSDSEVSTFPPKMGVKSLQKERLFEKLNLVPSKMKKGSVEDDEKSHLITDNMMDDCQDAEEANMPVLNSSNETKGLIEREQSKVDETSQRTNAINKEKPENPCVSNRLVSGRTPTVKDFTLKLPSSLKPVVKLTDIQKMRVAQVIDVKPKSPLRAHNTRGKVFVNPFKLAYEKLPSSKFYKCGYCEREFTRVDYLAKHVSKHMMATEHVCRTCGKDFSSLGNLRRHNNLHMRKINKKGNIEKKSVEGDYNPFCRACGVSFSNAGILQRHSCIARVDNGREANVDNLNNAIRRSKSLLVASRSTAIVDEIPLKKKLTVAELKRNFNEKFNKKLVVPLRRLTFPGDTDGFGNKCDIRLQVDDDECVSTSEMKDGTASVSSSSVDAIKMLAAKSAKKLSESVAKSSVVSSQNRRKNAFNCKSCKRNFGSRLKLKTHMKTHAVKYTRDRGSNQCEICKKGFASRSYMKIHMRIHFNERPYECLRCEDTFRTKYALVNHTKLCAKRPLMIDLASPVVLVRDESQYDSKSYMPFNQTDLPMIKASEFDQSATEQLPSVMGIEACKPEGETIDLIIQNEPDDVSSRSSSPVQFVCDECGDLFQSSIEVIQHKSDKHTAAAESEIKSKRTYNCELCNQSYESFSALWTHLRIQHNA